MPILIQWLHRRNYTERVWAAMRFLQAATKAQSRRLRFESLLLLLIRVLILVLAALAVAEPFFEAAGWLPQAQSSVHRLIVIDTSLSMQAETEGRAVSDRAREAAQRLINSGRQGDSYQLITLAGKPTEVVRQPSFDRPEVLAELDQLSWTEQFGDALGGLQSAKKLLDVAKSRRSEVTIISDFQRTNWWPEDSTRRRRIQQALAQIGNETRLSLIRVGPESSPNVAVVGVELVPPLATVDTTVQISAAIQRFGGAGDKSVRVELVENDRVRQTKSVDLTSTTAQTVNFMMRWREPGEHALQIRLAEDGLTADDHRWVTADIRDELAVLLVNGRETGDSLGRASDFVELALAPALSSGPSVGTAAGRPGRTNFRPVVVSEAEFSRTELAEFDCLFLCDVGFLSQAEQSRIEAFVRAGGGLVIGMGSEVQPGPYRKWLQAGGDGLMPVSLTKIIDADEAGGGPFHFAVPTTEHPIIEPFIGNPQAGLTTANIYRYYAVELPGVPSAAVSPTEAAGAQNNVSPGSAPVHVAVTFANGDPAIIDHVYGAGRVLLVTTSLDESWGSWALWPSFLPMMHRMTESAAAGGAASSLLVGQTWQRDFPLQTVGLSVNVQRPDGRRTPGRTRLEGSATRLTFDETDQSGIYRAVLGPPLNATQLVAVNVDPRESDLERLSEVVLQETLLVGIDARLVGEASQLAMGTVRDAPPAPLTRWLLSVVLVLLLVEQLMAWNARSGIVALLASPLLMAGLLWQPGVFVVLLLMALAALLARRVYGRWRAA